MAPKQVVLWFALLWLRESSLGSAQPTGSPLLEVGGLVKHLQDLYFPGCSLLIQRCPRKASSPKKNLHFPFPSGDTVDGDEDMKIFIDSVADSPVMVYDIDDNLEETLLNIDINIVSKCLVYVVLAFDIICALPLYTLVNKDWDKYFFSRKHIIYTESSADHIRRFLSTGETNTLSNLLVIRPGRDGDLFVSTNTPYKPLTASDSPLTTKTVWRRDKFVPSGVDFFPDKLKDMHGSTLRVVTFHFPPRLFIVPDEEGKIKASGVEIEEIRAISEALNFTLEFTLPTDGGMWGSALENGTWTGLMGDLQYRRADIGLGDLFIMEPYFAIIEMSINYDTDYLTFVNPTPKPLPQWVSLTLPFTPVIWGLLLLLIVIGMIFIVLLAKIGFVLSDSEELPWFRESSNLLLLLYGCVVNTPWIKEPNTMSLRIFTVLWALSFIILAVAYKGSLVSYLTVPGEVPPIDTHEQLYAKGINVGSIGTTLKGVMEQSADPFVRKLAERYESMGGTKEGFDRTVKGDFSFLENIGFLAYTIAVDFTDQYGRSSLHIMKEIVAPFGIGLGFPKYVPYIATFNKVIRRLTEAGVAEKWLQDLILANKRNRNLGDQAETQQEQVSDGVLPLNVNHLQGVFLLAAVGYGLALLVFILEVLHRVVLEFCQPKD
ncbi:ionotropic receptor 21a-like [Oratosquilla oratoria]|uniref:ionotropic receptor 21a-like n=1 Tax=Oratosquilla oratoria TaxID=337810 RepID=UPI003F75AED2